MNFNPLHWYRTYQAWRERRTKAKADAQYARGYRDALGLLRDGTYTPEALYNLLDAEQLWDTGGVNAYYDRGARAAIYDFEEEGLT